MSELVIKNTSRVIFDSAWPSVEDALKQRLAELKDVPGKEVEYQLAVERYTGLNIGDVSIEPINLLPNGDRVVCISSRKTGFARVDVKVSSMSAGEILTRITHTVNRFDTMAELLTFVATNPSSDQMAYVKETDRWFGFVPGVTPKEELASFLAQVFFDKGEWVETGTAPNDTGHYKLTVTDLTVTTGKGDIFIFDLKKLTPKKK